jgi:hypothetical protein
MMRTPALGVGPCSWESEFGSGGDLELGAWDFTPERRRRGPDARKRQAPLVYQSSRTVSAMTRGVIVPAASVVPVAVYLPVLALVFTEFSGWPAGVV